MFDYVLSICVFDNFNVFHSLELWKRPITIMEMPSEAIGASVRRQSVVRSDIVVVRRQSVVSSFVRIYP